MLPKVYFFCYPHGAPEKSGYEHQIVSLAEGLTALGVSIYSNVNYWPLSRNGTNFLIPKTEISCDDCDVVVFSSSLLIYNFLHILPDSLFSRRRKYKLVFIDSADGLKTHGFHNAFREVDLVLKSHYSKKYKYPSNFRPWQFGLTTRIINAVHPIASRDRERSFLLNFRTKHQLRELITNDVIPILSSRLTANLETDRFSMEPVETDEYFLWAQTGRRHYLSYYARLSTNLACLCFGGFLDGPKKSRRSPIGSDCQFDRIYQYDSWRFWESLVAGCCAIHVDLAEYGAILPEMPVNHQHYLGVDFKYISKFRKLLRSDKIFEDAGLQGREWVLSEYSPTKIAGRFLDMLSQY